MVRREGVRLRQIARKGYLRWHRDPLECLSYIDPRPNSISHQAWLNTDGDKGWSSGFGGRRAWKAKEKRLLDLMLAEQKKRDKTVSGWIPLVKDAIANFNALLDRIGQAMPLTCGYNVSLPYAISKLKVDLRENCRKQMLAKVVKANAGSAAMGAYKALKPKVHVETDYSRILQGESPIIDITPSRHHPITPSPHHPITPSPCRRVSHHRHRALLLLRPRRERDGGRRDGRGLHGQHGAQGGEACRADDNREGPPAQDEGVGAGLQERHQAAPRQGRDRRGYRYTPSRTGAHRYTPLRTVAHRYTPLHTVAHRHTALHTITYRYTPFHTVTCRHMPLRTIRSRPSKI